jgi:hypothetical protein
VLAAGAADVDENGSFTIRAGVSLVSVVPVDNPDGLAQIEDLHIWTAESIRTERLEFRPKQALQVLVVRAVRLPAPVTLPRLEAYGGCKSWIDLPAIWDGADGAPVHDDDRLDEDAARVRAAVG